MSTPETTPKVAFDPDGDIKSQEDALAYGQWLIEQRKLRQAQRIAGNTQEKTDGKPVHE